MSAPIPMHIEYIALSMLLISISQTRRLKSYCRDIKDSGHMSNWIMRLKRTKALLPQHLLYPVPLFLKSLTWMNRKKRPRLIRKNQAKREKSLIKVLPISKSK